MIVLYAGTFGDCYFWVFSSAFRPFDRADFFYSRRLQNSNYRLSGLRLPYPVPVRCARNDVLSGRSQTPKSGALTSFRSIDRVLICDFRPCVRRSELSWICCDAPAPSLARSPSTRTARTRRSIDEDRSSSSSSNNRCHSTKTHQQVCT